MRDRARRQAKPSSGVGHEGAACAKAQESARLDQALAQSSPASDPPALAARRAASEDLACAAPACAGDAPSNH